MECTSYQCGMLGANRCSECPRFDLVPYDWSLVELDMPWGQRKYIYQGRTINGYPESVMHFDDSLGWQPCPNINVHKRISELMRCKHVQ